MPKVYVTRMIPQAGIEKLKEKGYDVTINPDDQALDTSELIDALKGKGYDAVLCLLTDHVNAEVLDAAGSNCRIFANYAVGYENIDVKAASERNIVITNTPGILTESVAEHTFALMLAISRRIAEADRFVRAGKYKGWAPKLLLGNDVSGKIIGIVGLGRIGSRVAHHPQEDLTRVSYITTLQEMKNLKKVSAPFIEKHLKNSWEKRIMYLCTSRFFLRQSILSTPRN